MSGQPTILQVYAQYAWHSTPERLPAATLHHAKRALLDWLGATLAGMTAEVTCVVKRAAAEDLDRGSATLLSGRRATCRSAAMIHGVASHALEFDDIFRDGLFHPGGPVIAAALAAAAESGATGAELLNAIVVGYEISTRISAVVNPHHYRHWHTTGTVGCIGAAAAAGRLLCRSEEQLMHAMATATTFSSGLIQAFRSSAMTKPLHVGHAADVGVWAALGARAGLTGVADMLEGDAGFGAAMGNSPDWQHAVQGLGTEMKVAQITFKLHPCCGQTFSAIDALWRIREDHRVLASDVERIEVDTNREGMAITCNARPRDEQEARFSMACVLAHTLLHGQIRLDSFTPQRLAQTDLQELMARVSMKVDDDIQKAFPLHRSARVRVHLRDGRLLQQFQADRRGDPEDPLTDEDLDLKFFALVEPACGAARARSMNTTLRSFEQCASVSAFLESIRATTIPGD